jgi:hypothetical protein
MLFTGESVANLGHDLLSFQWICLITSAVRFLIHLTPNPQLYFGQLVRERCLLPGQLPLTFVSLCFGDLRDLHLVHRIHNLDTYPFLLIFSPFQLSMEG